MKDLLEFLAAYPLWVKIAVIVMATIIVCLLVFTRPAVNRLATSSSHASRDADTLRSCAKFQVAHGSQSPNIVASGAVSITYGTSASELLKALAAALNVSSDPATLTRLSSSVDELVAVLESRR